MSSDLVQKFPTLGECNRYTNGMCSARSCLIRGGWKQGDAVDYDLATCETRDIRRTIEALEGEVEKLRKKKLSSWLPRSPKKIYVIQILLDVMEAKNFAWYCPVLSLRLC
mgnify:CR=1 FL=1